jgi:hypothetical protein
MTRAAAMACNDGTTGTGTAGTKAAATASVRPSENGAPPPPPGPEDAVNRGDDWRDATRDSEPL